MVNKIGAGFILFLLLQHPVIAKINPVHKLASQFITLKQMPGAPQVGVISEIPLAQGSSEVERVIIMVHGTRRNATTYFKIIEKIESDIGISSEKVLILAPQFLTHKDIVKYQLPQSVLYWSHNGWKDGRDSLSLHTQDGSSSSFAVIDALITLITDPAKYPHLKKIIIAGHSAGAQFVHRYAVFNSIDEALHQKGIQIRYVAANASSYLYFDARRPLANGTFAVADEDKCENVNKYKYGLEDRIPYGSDTKNAMLAPRYLKRAVIYLVGAEDNDPHDPSMNRSCADEAQGKTRLARAKNYVNYLKLLLQGVPFTQSFYLVPHVGHSLLDIYSAPQGQAALFDVKRD